MPEYGSIKKSEKYKRNLKKDIEKYVIKKKRLFPEADFQRISDRNYSSHHPGCVHDSGDQQSGHGGCGRR